MLSPFLKIEGHIEPRWYAFQGWCRVNHLSFQWEVPFVWVGNPSKLSYVSFDVFPPFLEITTKRVHDKDIMKLFWGVSFLIHSGCGYVVIPQCFSPEDVHHAETLSCISSGRRAKKRRTSTARTTLEPIYRFVVW